MHGKALGQKVRQMRKKRAWTQSHLAAVAGISTRTLQRLESRGACAPETLMAIANAFDIDVREFTDTPFSAPLETNDPSFLSEQSKTRVMELPENPSFAQRTIIWGSVMYLGVVALAVLAAFLLFPESSYPLVVEGQENLDAVQYRKYIQQGAIVLAIMLGFWAGFSGALKKSWFFGLIVLGLGVLASVSAYSILPWLEYPHDRYSPGATWMFVGLVPLVVSWALVNIGFRVLERW